MSENEQANNRVSKKSVAVSAQVTAFRVSFVTFARVCAATVETMAPGPWMKTPGNEDYVRGLKFEGSLVEVKGIDDDGKPQGRWVMLLCGGLALAPSLAMGQALPPQLYSEMDGIHFLDDGSSVTIWGYGWVTDGFITLPGPLLTYNEGQSVDLNFVNPSPESHTIHLHGLDVDQANDGVPATSFLVPTGGDAVYSFVADQAGTFLYHCHVTTTLHLTMGMYGMILVKRPDQTLFEGGPAYTEDAPFLFSDLEVATNLDPVGSFPFHDIRPDVFMINGKQGSQLEAEDERVWSAPGDTVALRLGSMAYSRVRCHFPPELHAVCHMSDGRALPESFAVDSLDIFPGERFTILVAPEEGFEGAPSPRKTAHPAEVGIKATGSTLT